MSEEKPAGVKSAVSGWIKAVVTSIFGLITGAIIMYATPVVNNVIKPAKPVANFATQADGLTVRFNNRSTGGVEGWWDFGDGTALEPFDPKADNIKHDYPKTGTYQVKLSLQNLLGETGDRTAPVAIDADSATAAAPEIAHFELTSLDRRERVPAVYKLTSTVKNANYCILSYGDNRPMEIIDAAANQERYVTFDEMGPYTIRLAAVNGKKLIEQTRTVFINPNEEVGPIAKLQVTFEAIKVDRKTPRDWKIYCGWPVGARESVASFRKERKADFGCKIVSAELFASDAVAPVRNLKVEVSADQGNLVLTGELVRGSGSQIKPPHYVAKIKVVQESRSLPQKINRGDVAMSVNLKGQTMIPMQQLETGWEVVRKKVNLQLWDGTRLVWEGSKAMTSMPVKMNNQTCLVTVTPQSDAYLLKVDAQSAAASRTGPAGVIKIAPAVSGPRPPVGPIIRPASYQRNPLFPRRAK